MRHRGWWVLRYRERVGVGGEMKTVQRARRLAPIDATHKTRASVRQLAQDALEPLNKNAASPLTVTTLGDFCERVGVGGKLETVQKAKRLCACRRGAQDKSKRSRPRKART